MLLLALLHSLSSCPTRYEFGDSEVVPLEAGKTIQWKVYKQ